MWHNLLVLVLSGLLMQTPTAVPVPTSATNGACSWPNVPNVTQFSGAKVLDCPPNPPGIYYKYVAAWQRVVKLDAGGVIQWDFGTYYQNAVPDGSGGLGIWKYQVFGTFTEGPGYPYADTKRKTCTSSSCIFGFWWYLPNPLPCGTMVKDIFNYQSNVSNCPTLTWDLDPGPIASFNQSFDAAQVTVNNMLGGGVISFMIALLLGISLAFFAARFFLRLVMRNTGSGADMGGDDIGDSTMAMGGSGAAAIQLPGGFGRGSGREMIDGENYEGND